MPQYPYDAPLPVNYAHISNAGTVNVKATPGLLFGLTVNSGVTAATIQVIDSSSTVTSTAVIAGPITLTGTTVTPFRVEFGAAANPIQTTNGLTVLTTGTLDATLYYK